jgi:hypothetical protein
VGEAERSQRSQEKLVTRLQTDVRQLTSSVEEKRVSEERLETRTRELEDELRTLRHRFVTMQVKHSEAEQKLSLGATDRAAMEQEFRAQETSLTMLRSESATEATRLRAQLTSDAEEGTRAQKQLAQSEETVATLRARLRTLSEDAAQERRALELRARDASRSLSTLRSDNNALVASEQDALALAARHEQQAAAHAEQLETMQVELNALARSHASFESQNGLLCDRLEEKTRAALESAQTIAELRAALELAQTDGAGGSQDDRLRAERRARKDAATIASLRARVYVVNRIEVLRLICLCCSKTLYCGAAELSELAAHGEWLRAATDADAAAAADEEDADPDGKAPRFMGSRAATSALFLSLINTALGFKPRETGGWGSSVPYWGAMGAETPRAGLVDTALHTLLVLLDAKPKKAAVAGAAIDFASEFDEPNMWVQQLAAIEGMENHSFIYRNVTRLLKGVHASVNTFLPNSVRCMRCHTEVLLLLWKTIETNPAF